jgi:hypothetical protein
MYTDKCSLGSDQVNYSISKGLCPKNSCFLSLKAPFGGQKQYCKRRVLLPVHTEKRLTASINLQTLSHNPSIFVQTGLFQLFQNDEPVPQCIDHPDAAGSGGSLLLAAPKTLVFEGI